MIHGDSISWVCIALLLHTCSRTHTHIHTHTHTHTHTHNTHTHTHTHTQHTQHTHTDPYVKVYVVHKGRKHSKWKSTIKKNTLLPVFNEPFQFDISNLNIQDISLEFVVMDYDRFSKDNIVGHVQVGPSAKEEMGRTHWEELISSPNQPISRWHTILSLSHEEEREERGGFF